jgi:hypothetical protein
MPSGSVAPRCVPSASPEEARRCDEIVRRSLETPALFGDGEGAATLILRVGFDRRWSWGRTDFSRLRRAEIGQHHHISGKYLGAYVSARRRTCSEVAEKCRCFA